jgi:hypothetical protein
MMMIMMKRIELAWRRVSEHQSERARKMPQSTIDASNMSLCLRENGSQGMAATFHWRVLSDAFVSFSSLAHLERQKDSKDAQETYVPAV